ncbi:FAD-binding oxidoreductase [Synechococcus sp. PCC 7336]|uniref:NAD(P)/FAD-dependent oxidoreductase n=1 Tax=Synechococcus sp. PCC 7336 TaxID=195250 RepID=UPI0003448BEC|nr:FAD-dependent oxidoreductase [Synechococcus sp. PCC 7336]
MPETIPTTADIVAIGGGINGLCIALHLARRGCKVVLLEKNFIGGGPTGRSLAVISQHYTRPALARLARTSLEIFRNFEAHYDGGCGWVEAGLLVLVGATKAAELQQAVAMQQAQSIAVERVPAERLPELDPRLEREDVAIASYQPTAGYANPQQTLHTLQQAAIAAGVQICEGVAAIEVSVGDSAVRGVVTEAGAISAAVVVDAAGPWAAAIASSAGTALPLVSCRQVMAVLQRSPDFGSPHPIVNDFIGGISFRSEGQATYVGRFDRRQTEDPVGPDDFDETVPGESVKRLADAWKHRYPCGARSVTWGGWCGLYDVTPDWMPIVDRLGPEGFYACCGGSGHGFKFGPLFGQLLADWIVSGTLAETDLTVLSGRRFLPRVATP